MRFLAQFGCIVDDFVVSDTLAYSEKENLCASVRSRSYSFLITSLDALPVQLGLCDEHLAYC